MNLRERDLYFVTDWLWRISYLDGYNAVINTGLYDFIKNNEIKSFMFNVPECKKKEFQALSLLADVRSLHSGASYGLTMRVVEKMVKMGFDDWKIWYIECNRLDMIEKVNIIIRYFRKCVSNPEYRMCKNRLLTEYFELII